MGNCRHSESNMYVINRSSYNKKQKVKLCFVLFKHKKQPVVNYPNLFSGTMYFITIYL